MTENDANPPINYGPMEKRNEFIDHPSYIVHMALLQEMEYFIIWASTSGVDAEASFYSLQDKLLCNCVHFIAFHFKSAL